MLYVLTGATGALGGELLLRLVAQGQHVLPLARPSKTHSAATRVADIIGTYIPVLVGDVTRARCGVSADDIDALRGTDVAVIHVAASVKFEEAQRQNILKTNVEGTRNALAFAEAIDATAFHYVSTAYVAGDAPFFSEDMLDAKQRFRNPYEESKAHAEQIVRTFARRARMPYAIYRPSIITGNASDGKTRTFDGYYGFWYPFFRTKMRYCPDGWWSPRLRIPCGDSTLNLVPSDWVSEAITRLVRAGAKDCTYQLAHPDPPLVREVIKWSLAHLRIRSGTKGVLIGQPDTRERSRRDVALQRGLMTQIKRYEPYITHEAHFAPSQRAPRILGDFAPPPIDQKLLGRLLEYAVDCWSKREVAALAPSAAE